MPSSRMTSTTSGWTRSAGVGAGRQRAVASAGGLLEERRGHLRAPGVLAADEERGGHGAEPQPAGLRARTMADAASA